MGVWGHNPPKADDTQMIQKHRGCKLKEKILFFIEFFAVLAILMFGANAYCQTVDFTITSQGDMDGHNGYYRTMTIDDSLYQTDFEFVEGDYARVYAYKMSWDFNFHVLPESTYLSRVNDLQIGQTWRSWVFEPVTALVADTETLNLPLGNFFTYQIIFTNASGDTNFIAWGSYNVGGVQLYFSGYIGAVSEYSIVGGQGYWPLAVGNFWRYEIATTIDEPGQNAPRIYSLSQNYPNPFNAQTTINYSLPHAGPINLTIDNILGQKVVTLFEGLQSAGSHSIIWDASNITSGIYFYRIQAGDYAEARKCLLLK